MANVPSLQASWIFLALYLVTDGLFIVRSHTGWILQGCWVSELRHVPAVSILVTEPEGAEQTPF